VDSVPAGWVGGGVMSMFLYPRAGWWWWYVDGSVPAAGWVMVVCRWFCTSGWVGGGAL
jgi:hypothetical protein